MKQNYPLGYVKSFVCYPSLNMSCTCNNTGNKYSILVAAQQHLKLFIVSDSDSFALSTFQIMYVSRIRPCTTSKFCL